MENNLTNQNLEDNTPSILSLVSILLKKYGVEETEEDAYRKIKNGEESSLVATTKLSRSFAKDGIMEKDLSFSLQKNLSTTPEIAQKIITDIKTDILPLMIKTRSKDEKGMPVTSTETSKIPQIVEPEKRNSQASPEMNRNNFMETIEPVKIPRKLIKKTDATAMTAPRRGPDSYREPIE